MTIKAAIARRADEARAVGLPVRTLGAALCLAIAVIHVIDQDGFPGSREPGYIGLLYYALEAAGVLAALLLLTGRKSGWLLALGVAVGPIVGYALSRGPGLPDYSDDIGNWAEPLGVLALAVEGLLLAVTLSVLVRLRPPRRR